MKESQIQKGIIYYLSLLENLGKLSFQRINTVGVYDKEKELYRKLPVGVKAGFPDILVLMEGRCIGLEVKTAKGRQSEQQKQWEKRFNTQGFEYYIVRNNDDVIKIIEGGSK